MASDIFAKIGDIKGESLDSKHKDEVEVLSWSWGVQQTGTMSHGGGGGEGARRRKRGGHLVSKMRSEIATDLAGILAGMDEDQAETVEHTKRAIAGRAIA